MAKRNRMSRGQSRKAFSRASGTHRKNLNLAPMRGGIRL